MRRGDRGAGRARRERIVALGDAEAVGEGLAGYVALAIIFSADQQVLAVVGETCDRVPAAAKRWLVRQGAIERIGED